MYKIFVVARREYLAAVRTRAFLISILLMPLLMTVSVFVQKRADQIRDLATYKVAVIDRTPDQQLAPQIVAAAKKRNTVDRFDPKTGQPIGPAYDIEVIDPAPLADQAAVDRQRFRLSERTRTKELLAFIEIGPKVVEPNVADLIKMGMTASTQVSKDASPTDLQGNLFAMLNKLPDDAIIRYSTSQPTFTQFRTWLSQALAQPVISARMTKMGINPLEVVRITSAILPPPIVDRGMADQSPAGKIVYDASNANIIVNWIVPVALVGTMFVVVMVGASPMTTNIVEEKQLRIAEVLLGGLRPFELMLGKLLGGAAVSLTLAILYCAGALALAWHFDALQYLHPATAGWFVLFTILGVLMYGSLFVAAGAAVTNVKEAQAALSPILLVVAAPLIGLHKILEYPDSALARAGAWFPLTAPTIAIIRSAIPGAAAVWEMLLSALSAIVGTLLVVWIGGRVFRAGMLLTSKPATVREAIRWVVRG